MKSLIFICLILVNSVSFAATNSLPENCKYGRSKNYDVDAGDVASAVKDGFDVYGDPYNINEWLEFADSIGSLLDSFDYLRYEGSKHVLQGQSFRAKGNLFDIYAYVHFHNSEKGFIGKDKSNLDANSYHNMSFDTTYGYGLAWVSRGSLCSAEGVWVQKSPKILSANKWSTYETINAEVDYLIDAYARATKDSSVPVRITLNARSDLFGTSQSYSVTTNQLSGLKTVSFQPNAGGGAYYLRATVSDGTFSTTYNLGEIWVPGTAVPPCPNCQPL
ncbi:MAG: hypothetical protein ACI9SP_004244 [Arenicella sp.]|jgi:hypothetical protein